MASTSAGRVPTRQITTWLSQFTFLENVSTSCNCFNASNFSYLIIFFLYLSRRECELMLQKVVAFLFTWVSGLLAYCMPNCYHLGILKWSKWKYYLILFPNLYIYSNYIKSQFINSVAFKWTYNRDREGVLYLEVPLVFQVGYTHPDRDTHFLGSPHHQDDRGPAGPLSCHMIGGGGGLRCPGDQGRSHPSTCHPHRFPTPHRRTPCVYLFVVGRNLVGAP